MECRYCDTDLENASNPTKLVQGNLEEGDIEGTYFRYYCSESCLTNDLVA